jgi:hypothetical protein
MRCDTEQFGRYTRFEILTAVTMKRSIFWDIKPGQIVMSQKTKLFTLTDTDILEECANSSSENKEGK